MAANGLVSLQLGISFVLLIASALLVRTLWNVVHRDPGFDAQNTLVVSIDLARAGYTQEKGLAFQRALWEKLRNAPGVEGASLTSYVPMGATGGGRVRDVTVSGYTPAKDESMSIVTDTVAPDYFGTMRIPILRAVSSGGRTVAPRPASRL